MSGLKIGYARVSTDQQDLTAQPDALEALGVAPDRVYVAMASLALTAPAPASERRSRAAGLATSSS